MKTQVNSRKISSFPKIINPKLFDNSWGNSCGNLVSGGNLLFYVSTLHGYGVNRKLSEQEAEWVNINFERRGLNSPQKSQLLPYDFGEIYFLLYY